MTMLHIILYKSNMHEANIYNRRSYSPKFRPLPAVENSSNKISRTCIGETVNITKAVALEFQIP